MVSHAENMTGAKNSRHRQKGAKRVAMRLSCGTRIFIVFTLNALLITGWLPARILTSNSAQAETISWPDDSCYNTISYSPKKYNTAELKNTVHLLFGPRDMFNTPAIDWPTEPQHIARLDLERTREECTAALKRTTKLKFISLKGMEEYIQMELAGLKDGCELATIKIRGYQNPSALREYQPAQEQCSQFIDALEGKTDLEEAYQDLARQNCSDNGFPDQCLARWRFDGHGMGGVEQMRFHLLRFGWWNCVMDLPKRIEARQKREQRRIDLEKEFHRQFKITSECDEYEDGIPMASLEIDNATGTPDGEWSFRKNLGLFCQSAPEAEGHPRKIEFKAFEPQYQSFKIKEPIEVTLAIDGKASQLTLQPHGMSARTYISPDLLRRLLHARAASIVFKSPEISPNTGRLKLDGLDQKVRFGLSKCFKP